MTTTPAVASQAVADIDALIDEVFTSGPTLLTREFASGIGLSFDAVREAIERGELSVVRVSARRIVITRGTARRWLLSRLDADQIGGR